MTAATQAEDFALVEQDQPEQAPRALAPAAAPPEGPAAMMLTAMERGASLDQIEKMMDLLERWEKREAEKAFRESFAAFRGENIIIPKTRHVDRGRGGSFSQAEYDEVCRRLSPALSRHGFGFRHTQRFGSQRHMNDGVENDVPLVWVTCFLEHRKGHAEVLELEGPPGELSVNTPTQNMQVTASYLKRQSLLAITGTATGGEDDEAGMRRHQGDAASEDEDFAAALAAGQEAAMKGMKALLAWWGDKDNKKVRDLLQREYPKLRAAAEAADKQGADHG